MTILDLLTKHESSRGQAYLDCCGKYWRDCQCPHKGKLTIGIGRNLDDNPLTPSERQYLAENDIGRVRDQLDKYHPWWRTLDDVRQMVLLDMCFNLGIARFCSFSKTLSHVKAGEYEQAAKEMLDSLWASQVGPRATRLAAMMRTGSIEEASA